MVLLIDNGYEVKLASGRVQITRLNAHHINETVSCAAHTVDGGLLENARQIGFYALGGECTAHSLALLHFPVVYHAPADCGQGTLIQHLFGGQESWI